jgi:hypothetical protein
MEIPLGPDVSEQNLSINDYHKCELLGQESDFYQSISLKKVLHSSTKPIFDFQRNHSFVVNGISMTSKSFLTDKNQRIFRITHTHIHTQYANART